MITRTVPVSVSTSTSAKVALNGGGESQITELSSYGAGTIGASVVNGAIIASGDSSIVVSATQIESGANIMTGLGITSVATHQTLNTSVNSVVTNTSMVLQVHRATIGAQQVWWTVIENVD